MGPAPIPGLPGSGPVATSSTLPQQSAPIFPEVGPDYLAAAEAYRAGRAPESEGRLPRTPEETAGEAEVSRLQGQLDRSRGMAEHLGEEVPEDKPGFFMRALDVLQRGNYASAEGMDRLTKGIREDGFDFGDITDTVKGIGSGLAGRSKTTYQDVLKDRGLEGKGWSALGFAGDVLLDPTTYVGVGLVKTATKEAAKAAGLKAASRTLNDPAVAKAIQKEVADEVSQKLQARLAPKASGKTLAYRAPSKTKFNKEVSSRLNREAKDAYKVAEQKIKNESVGALTVKLLGKEVARSEKAYAAGSKLAAHIKKFPVMNQLNYMLRPVAQLGDLHEMHRIHEGMSYAQFHRATRPIMEKYSHISDEAAKRATHLYQQGRVHELDGELRAAMDEFKTHMDSWWGDEAFVGMQKNPMLPNYVPGYYKAGDDTVETFKVQRKAKLSKIEPNWMKHKQFATLEEAKQAGLKPIEDFREIFQRRAAEHYQKIAHRSFIDDAMRNFGLPVEGKAAQKFKKAIEVQRKQGNEWLDEDLVLLEKYGNKAYVPQKIANIIENLDTLQTKPAELKALGKRLDSIQNAMKAGYTVYRPGHHFRNAIGDIFLNFEDGVVNPKVYKIAAEIVSGDAHKIGSDAYMALENKSIKVGNRMVSYRKIHDLYNNVGLKTGFMGTEISRTSNNKVGQIARTAASMREDTARIAHFVDVLKKEGKKYKNIDEEKLHNIARVGGDRVRKFNLDYGDLTPQEKQIRRYVMFYTFVRKNLPLQVEMLLTRPGRVATVPKAYNAIEEMLGTSEKDPNFEDQVPEWIREAGYLQIGGGNTPLNAATGSNNDFFSTLQLPVSDLDRLTTSPQKLANMLLSELRPELKAVGELGSGTQAFSGAPAPGASQYAVQQLPFAHAVRKLTDPEASTQQRVIALINELTGAGIQEVTEQRKKGELRRKLDATTGVVSEKRKSNKEEFIKGLG